MTQPDYYQLLGVKPSATLEQIKAAYRRQALRHHPDKNPGSEQAAERFKLCNEAYAVLSDPGRRSRYDDRTNQRGVQDIAREIIGDFLGGGRRRRALRQDGKDLRFELAVTLRESALGVEKQIRFPAPETCDSCDGGGAAPGGTVRCPACDGRGDARETGGLLSFAKSCPRCGGQGVTIKTVCPDCGGIGTVERTRTYSVKLPPGVKEGDVKILDGEGELGIGGGRSGDLHIVIHVEPHPLLVPQGTDLALDLPVRFASAVSGAVVSVPTLMGQVRMKVPAGTQSGRTFRLKGKGLSGPGGIRGDQLVRVVVETPVNLDPEALQLLGSYDRCCPPESHPQLREFEGQIQELDE